MERERCGTETLTLGVEEEFLIFDAGTGLLIPAANQVLRRARQHLGERVKKELNLCQIEVDSRVCTSLAEVRDEVFRLRRGLCRGAAEAGCAVAATGTPPFGSWHDQQVDVAVERYRRMEDSYQAIARQQVIAGCHVHVGIPDDELAIAVMNRVRPWLPILMALSANSPFWQGLDTGFASYRLQVWQRWPTSGMPPTLASPIEFHNLVRRLVSIGAIEDATFLYWYVRPSARYPTLEFRSSDVCLSADETVAVAGLVRALAWTCLHEAVLGRPMAEIRRELLEAAMWRAGRYGLDSELISASTQRPVPAARATVELLGYVREGLEVHGDWDEVSRLVSNMLTSGNGAARQRAAFALRSDPRDVVDRVVEETRRAALPEPEFAVSGLRDFTAATPRSSRGRSRAPAAPSIQSSSINLSGTMEPLRNENAQLLPLIERLRHTADDVGVVSVDRLRIEIDENLDFLIHRLIPHATAQDKAFYPTVRRAMGAHEATATMSREHVEVDRLTHELSELGRRLAGSEAVGEDLQRALRRLLYGLYTLVRVHLMKEDEVYLPLLEERLTAAEADALLHSMGEAIGAA